MNRRHLSGSVLLVAITLTLVFSSGRFRTSHAPSPFAPVTTLLAQTTGCVEQEQYSENFDAGWASNWYLGPGFRITSEAGRGRVLAGASSSGVTSGSSRSIAAYLLGDYWTDLSFSFDMMLTGGEFWASFRYSPDTQTDYAYDRILGSPKDRYYVKFTSGSVLLGRTRSGTDTTLATASSSFSPNQWYAVRLAASGGSLSVYINNAQVINATDADAISSGSIELEVKSRGEVEVDNLQVAADVPCEYTWQRTAAFPVGGDINVIAVDPKDSNIVYAGTEHMGLWKSADGGLTWAEVGYSGDMGRLGKTDTIGIAPSDTKIVYASWGNEVDQSVDGGLHWARTGLMNTIGRIWGLAVDSSNPNVVYVAAGGGSPTPNTQGVFKSSDGGQTWQHLGSDSAALSVAISPRTPNTVFFGMADGIYRSTDGGTSWTRVYTGAAPAGGARPAGVPSLAIDPTDPSIVYGVADGTVKSTNGGNSWTKVRTGGDQVVVSPSHPNVVYVVSRGAIFKSSNRGESWSAAPPWTIAASELRTIAIDSSNPDKMHAGTWGQGLLFSKDGGTTWSKPTLSLVPADLGTGVAIDPRDDNKIYVGTARGEVYASRDQGTSWSRLANLGTGTSTQSLITALLVDPFNSSIIYAGSAEGLYKSSNGGANWKGITSGLSYARVISLAVDPKSPNNLFAGTGNSKPRNVSEGSGIFYSANGGESWSKAQGVPDAPVPAIVVSPSQSQILYAAVMGAGIYKSVNGGLSWSQVNNGLTSNCLYAVAVDPKDPNVAYAGTSSSYCKAASQKNDHVYRTKNGGTSWEIVLKGENILDNVEAIAVDPGNPLNIYVAYHTEKVWVSRDGGTTWKLGNKGVIRHGAHLYLWAITANSDGSTVYIITCGLGVLRNNVKAAEQ